MDKNIDRKYLQDNPKLQLWLPNSIKDEKERQVEFERWKALTSEERWAEIEAYSAKVKQNQNKKSISKEEQIIENAKHNYIFTDSVNSLENVEATILWLVVMGVGAIFHGRLIIWIIATIIWLSYIFRYKIREYKWDNGGKEEYFEKINQLNKNGGNK